MSDNNEEYISPPGEAEVDVAYQDLLKTSTSRFRQTAQRIVELGKRTRRIPEPFFYVKMLPVLRDIVRGIPNSSSSEYFNIIDGVSQSALVYDDLTGENLFYIPPVLAFSRPVIIDRANGRKVITPNDVVELQEVYRKNGDARALMTIEKTLPSLFDANSVYEETEALDQLIFIYKRYELDLTELFGERTDEFVNAYNERTGQKSESTEVTNSSTNVAPEFKDDDYEF